MTDPATGAGLFSAMRDVIATVEWDESHMRRCLLGNLTSRTLPSTPTSS